MGFRVATRMRPRDGWKGEGSIKGEGQFLARPSRALDYLREEPWTSLLS